MTATVNDQSITITDESLTVSESVGIYECDFTFDASWDTWNKTAVFEGAGATIEMIVVDNKAQIPREVLKEAGWIKVGVYGTKGGEIKPTIWSDQIYVAAGTVPGSVEVTPTPSIYAQILDLANDAKDTADDVASDWASVSATATTLSAGSPAAVTFADNTFAFGIPKGAKGDTGATGATGATPDFSIGTVSTLETGQPATATITGTAAAPVLNLGLPKGNKGDNGDVANVADAYSTSATYAVGDYCIYNSQLYRCTTVITTAEAWTAAHWTAVQLGDDTSTLRSALNAINGEAIHRDLTYHPIVNVLNPNDLTAGYLDTSGGHHNNQYRSYTGFIPVAEGDILRCYRRVSVNTLRLTNDGYAKFYVVTAYNTSKVAVSSAGKSSDTTPYTVPSGIAYVRLSFYNELKDGKGMVTINNEVTEFVPYGDSYTANSAFLEGAFTETTEQPVISKGYRTVTGALNDGDKLEIESTTCKYGLRYAFSGKITSFSSITLSHGGSSGQNSSWIVVDGTKITVYGRYNASSPIQTYEYTHGLTISDFISIEVIQLKDRHAAKVYLQTNDGTYVIDEVYWYGYSSVNITAESNGSVLTDCVLSFSSSGFRKSLWLFGDSYISDDSTARWAYYLKQDGFFDNVMLAGYPGAAPREMYPMFTNALAYGRPYMCVWALGMNGDADTSSAIGTLYYDYLMWFLDKCKIYNIIPILCTIPTVPSLYHEKRNEFVRSSGYRYIDFADAVGAQADGTWYSGMLSEDNVHPTSLGAQALYLRALRDCPELTYDLL